MKPKRWKLGDRVIISPDTYARIVALSESTGYYPCDSWTSTASRLMVDGVAGTVDRLFPPWYEVNVAFDNGVVLQVKDHWIEELP